MKLNTTISNYSSLIVFYLCTASGNVYAQDAATEATTTVLNSQESPKNTQLPSLITTPPSEATPLQVEEADVEPKLEVSESGKARESNLPKIGAGLKLSTLGYGIDFAANIAPKINVRLSLNKLDYDFDDSTSDETGLDEITDDSIALSNHGLILDYHPLAGTFRLSLGLFSSSNKVKSQSKGFIENEKFGDSRYDIEGEVVSTGKMDGTIPYIGIGWGNTLKEGSALSLSFDLGVLLGTDASIELDATGDATELSSGVDFDINDTSNEAAAEFQRQLQSEVDDKNDDISGVLLYPVISLGLNYRFN